MDVDSEEFMKILKNIDINLEIIAKQLCHKNGHKYVTERIWTEDNKKD